MSEKNIFSQTVTVLRRVLKESYAKTVAVAAGAGALLLDYWLLTRVTTLSGFLEEGWRGDFGSWSRLYVVGYGVLMISFAVLFGLSMALIAWQFRRSFAGRKKNLLAGGAGIVGNAFGAGCPMCGAFLLQSLGVVGGIGIFPLKGLEFQLIGVGAVLASTLASAKRIAPSLDGDETCERCEAGPAGRRLDLERPLVILLIILFALNHVLIGQVASAMGMKSKAGGGVGRFLGSLVGIKTAAAKTIIATKLNPDGLTTTLAEWPTITEIPANPNTGDAVADAKVVMIPTGTPFYAPEGISFDDPVAALEAWGKYEDSIKLSGDLEARWQKIIGTMTCDYCCGSPTRVTTINRCGCNHAKAWRSIAKYLIQNYGDKYSDDEIIGELKRWRGAWYPKGSIEDYLLATGKGDAVGHETHGGAGSDGRHGF